jgi:hypothetical protein
MPPFSFASPASAASFALIVDRGAPPVADHADINKMHAQNLAIVFAPCLLRPENDDLMYAPPPHTHTSTQSLHGVRVRWCGGLFINMRDI